MFNPKDWYWIVNADATRYWSSNRQVYVPSNDVTFAAWVATPGNSPTPVDSEATLMTVFDAIYPPGWPGGDADAWLAAGLVITSTGSSVVNGTYKCDDAARKDIVHIISGINAGGVFPGGGSTFNYPDASGTVHLFPNTTVFVNFAIAMRNFYFATRAAQRTLRGGGSATYPTAATTIA